MGIRWMCQKTVFIGTAIVCIMCRLKGANYLEIVCLKSFYTSILMKKVLHIKQQNLLILAVDSFVFSARRPGGGVETIKASIGGDHCVYRRRAER